MILMKRCARLSMSSAKLDTLEHRMLMTDVK